MTRAPIVALLLMVLASGCTCDECESGQSECIDANTIRRCVSGHDGHAAHYIWMRQTCPFINSHCVTREDVAGTAVCASSPDRSAACVGGDFCADDIAYECVDGFAVVNQLCTNGCAATTCAP